MNEQQSTDLAKQIEKLEWWAKKHERLAILFEKDNNERLARSCRKITQEAREQAQALAN